MIEKSQFKEFLVNIIKDDDITINDISDDTIMIGENGIFFDSVDVLELIVELDNKFRVKIQDNDIIEEKLKTFQSFFEFVKDKLK